MLRSFTKLFDRFLRKKGKSIAGKAVKLYSKATKSVESEIEAMLDELGLDGWTDIVATVDEGLLDVMLATNAATLTQLASSDGNLLVVNELAKEFAERRAAELVGMRYDKNGDLVVNPDAEWAITDSTRNRLRQLITDAFKKGITPQELADSIEEDYAFSSSRALTIARTEVSRAHTRASLNAATESGVVSGKRNLLSSSHAVEDDCDLATEDGTIPLDQPFSGSGELISPHHPLCTCGTAYEVMQ